MSKPPCPECDHTHASNDGRAIGRFRPEGPFGYVPNFPDITTAPIYATREEAEKAMCDHRRSQP